MPLHVKRQVVRPRERALAQLAVERFVAGVLALVAGQLVRAGKTPAAVGPLANVRLLPGVSAQVGLKMGGFCVGLPTAGMLAHVGGGSLFRRGHPDPVDPACVTCGGSGSSCGLKTQID